MISLLLNEYYDNGKPKGYVKAHPPLGDYFDWLEEYKVRHPELEPYLWQSKETSEKATVTVDLETMIADYDGLPRAMELVALGQNIPPGALEAMKEIYGRAKPGIPFKEWMRILGYTQ